MCNLIHFKNVSYLLTLGFGTTAAFAAQNENSNITLGNFDSNIFLVEESQESHKNIIAKVAQNLNGESTLGGVTGLQSELSDFSIPLVIATPFELNTNTQPILKIRVQPSQNIVCTKLNFTINQNSIKILPNNLILTTATNCEYSVYNSEDTKIANFRILLNHTFNHWCNQADKSLEAYKTARNIAPTCEIDPSSITYIKINNKEIRDLSPIAGFHHLNELNLGENKINSLPVGIFDKFKQLDRLLLQNNKLTAIPRGVLDKLTKLAWLWLMDNEINDLPLGVFDKLENLEWLSLYNNKLENLPKGLLAKLKSLKSIELSNNKLTIFPSDISKLNHLISIEIHSNQISEIPAGAFAQFHRETNSLTNLSLSGNKLVTLPDGLFSTLKHLYFLKLANNSISHLPQGIFDGLSNLNFKELDLSGNPINQERQDFFYF
jgi:Leucine-rich repeat (LRR) protein